MTTVELSSALDPQTFSLAFHSTISKTGLPIETLHITKNNLNFQCVQEVFESNVVANLKNLSLPENFLSKNTEDAISTLSSYFAQGYFPKLQRLDLSFNYISNVDALCLSISKSVPGLRELVLRYNNLGPSGAPSIAKLVSSGFSLDLLDLTSNDLGDRGTTAICEALGSAKANVRKLVLWGNKISDASASGLCSMLRVNRTLLSLDLTSNELSQDSLELLYKVLQKENTVLEDISITGNPIKNRLIVTKFTEFCAKRSHVKSFQSPAPVLQLSSEAKSFLEQQTPLVHQYSRGVTQSAAAASSHSQSLSSSQPQSLLPSQPQISTAADLGHQNSEHIVAGNLKEEWAQLQQERLQFESEKEKFRDYCNKKERELQSEREQMLRDIKAQLQQQIAKLVDEAKEKDVVLNVVFKQ